MMIHTILVCYDIEKDRDRSDLIELLIYYHLARIQYSVFLGSVSESEYRELIRRIKSEFTRDSVKILILEICERCQQRVIVINEEISQAFDDFVVL